MENDTRTTVEPRETNNGEQYGHIMTHTDYDQLAGRLRILAGEADRTRALLTMALSVNEAGAIVATSTPDDAGTPVEVDRTQLWMAVEQVDTDIDSRMAGWEDVVVEVNQARADKGLESTADDRLLYQAMERFMAATSTPVPGRGVLYARTRTRCRTWMDRFVGWFPDLYPRHIRVLLSDDQYKKAVEDGQITPRFTWNESIKALAGWLDDNIFEIEEFKVVGKRHKWSLFDGVFLIKGQPITATQLKKAFNE